MTSPPGAPPHPAATVVACPDGPLLVRGDVRIVGPDGTEIPRHRRTVALCRCGRSGLAPWCDGTHKLVRFRDAAAPVPASDVTPEEDACAPRRRAAR